MKAIILAAGKGSRISDAIGPVPKATLEISGRPIIRRMVELLHQYHVKVAVCTGYRRQKIEEALKGLEVSYFNNPFYDVTNNISSLWFAQDFLEGDDCVIISADVVFGGDLLEKVLTASGDLVMITDSGRVMDGDYFFHMNSDGTIGRFGPDIPMEERNCEYVGLARISSKCVPDFRKRLIQLIDEGRTQCYFEYVFFSYIGDPDTRLTTLDVDGCMWREIDRMDDYRKAVREFERQGRL